MNPRVFVVLAMLAWCASTAGAQSYFVRASRTAVVHETPRADGRELLRLERGQELNCVTNGQTDGYYNVLLSDGGQGWVSRYVVRLWEGASTDAPSAGAAPGSTEGLTPTERQWAGFHLAVGAPRGYQELVRRGYVVGYDPRLKIPVWVQYRLTREMSENDSAPDTRNFRPDGAVRPQARATDDDYTNSGYARGHSAPLDDMRYSDTAASESNLFTNISPQIGASFNSSVWGSLEGLVRGWVLDRRDLVVITGPVFRPREAVHPVERQPETPEQVLYNVIGDDHVAVPDGFFKIVVDMRTPDHPDVIAFLVDHVDTLPKQDDPAPAGRRERDPARWLTSVDKIEQATGLDFLTALPESVQDEVESRTATALW